MVDEIEGVVKDVPVPKLEPPEEAAYQFMVAVPLDAAAAKLTVPAPHLAAPVVDEMVGMEFTVATTAVLEAGVQLFNVGIT